MTDERLSEVDVRAVAEEKPPVWFSPGPGRNAINLSAIARELLSLRAEVERLRASEQKWIDHGLKVESDLRQRLSRADAVAAAATRFAERMVGADTRHAPGEVDEFVLYLPYVEFRTLRDEYAEACGLEARRAARAGAAAPAAGETALCWLAEADDQSHRYAVTGAPGRGAYMTADPHEATKFATEAECRAFTSFSSKAIYGVHLHAVEHTFIPGGAAAAPAAGGERATPAGEPLHGIPPSEVIRRIEAAGFQLRDYGGDRIVRRADGTTTLHPDDIIVRALPTPAPSDPCAREGCRAARALGERVMVAADQIAGRPLVTDGDNPASSGWFIDAEVDVYRAARRPPEAEGPGEAERIAEELIDAHYGIGTGQVIVNQSQLVQRLRAALHSRATGEGAGEK